MAGFWKTLNLSKYCQINALPKCGEDGQKSIPKQNLVKNVFQEDNILFYKKNNLWSKKIDFIK